MEKCVALVARYLCVAAADQVQSLRPADWNVTDMRLVYCSQPPEDARPCYRRMRSSCGRHIRASRIQWQPSLYSLPKIRRLTPFLVHTAYQGPTISSAITRQILDYIVHGTMFAAMGFRTLPRYTKELQAARYTKPLQPSTVFRSSTGR
jgi:hypothetical protein